MTPTSLVSMVLLASGPRAASLEDVATEAADLETFARTRQLPGAAQLGLDTPQGTRATLDALVRGGVVACYEDGPEAVFSIRDGKHLAAAYYRNGVLHFFLAAAVAEIALVAAAEANVAASREMIVAEISTLRDLLKFEFFFPERSAFEAEVIDEIARTDPGWEESLRPGREAIRGWFDRRRPLVAPGALRPFVEGYAIVAEELVRHPEGELVNAETFVSSCVGRGAQRVLQGRITSHDAATRETIKNGLELARHRGLLSANGTAGRAALLESTRAVRRRIEAVAKIAARRHTDPFA